MAKPVVVTDRDGGHPRGAVIRVVLLASLDGDEDLVVSVHIADLSNVELGVHALVAVRVGDGELVGFPDAVTVNAVLEVAPRVLTAPGLAGSEAPESAGDLMISSALRTGSLLALAVAAPGAGVLVSAAFVLVTGEVLVSFGEETLATGALVDGDLKAGGRGELA